jgi:hypothetical protein
MTLAFDIEHDHDLDGAMRLDASKYPSVAWDSITFECGAGGAANTYEVRLLDHATVIAGSQTPAKCCIEISGSEILDGGIDWLHLFFRDRRYAVTSTDVRVETTLTMSATTTGAHVKLYVADAAGFKMGDTVTIERGDTNEETTAVIDVGSDIGPYIVAWVTETHAGRVLCVP